MEWTSIVNSAHDCTITLVGDAAATRDVTIQLKDYAGNDLKVKNVVYMYVSTDDAGDATTIVDKIDITTNGDGDLLELLADNFWVAVSEDDGDIAITIEETDNVDVYLNVILPNGRVVTSELIEMTG